MSTAPHQRLHRVTVDGVGVVVATVQHVPSTITLAWLHGLGGASTLDFATAARHPALAGVTSLLIDLPGFGRSGQPANWDYAMESHAEIVLEVLSRIAEGPAALFGHSMGGSIAILCAARDPETVTQLIVAEPNREAGGGPTSARIAAQPEDDYLSHGHEVLIRAARREAATRHPAPDAWLQSLQLASPVAMHRSAASLVAPRSPSFGEAFDALTVPRAMLVGESSDSGFRIPGIPTHVVPNAGHQLMADNPGGFVVALVAALEQPVAPRFC